MNLVIPFLFFIAVGNSSQASAAGNPLLHLPSGIDSESDIDDPVFYPASSFLDSSSHSSSPSSANLSSYLAASSPSAQPSSFIPSERPRLELGRLELPLPDLSLPELALAGESLTESTVLPLPLEPTEPSSLMSQNSTPSAESLVTSLTAVGIKLSRGNRLAGLGEDEDIRTKSFFPALRERIKFKNWDGALGYSRKISCNGFTGTHAGNKIYFRAEANGGSGRYIHSLIYTLNSSFESPEAGGKQFELSRKGNGKLKLKLPPLRDDVSYVQLTVLLLSRDLQNPRLVASQSLTFLVARPVILSVSNSPEAKQKACFERFLPYPSTMGILSNGSKNPSKIEIQQAIQNSWATTKGWQAGVFFSPLSFLTIGNLFFFNFSYFQQTTKKVVETVAVSTDFRLDPGEFMQIYTQPTRYITPYDATLVEACGQTRKVDGAYLFQWWGYSYIPFPIHPDRPDLPSIERIGAPAINTCPPEFTPLVGERAPGTYEFRSTM